MNILNKLTIKHLLMNKKRTLVSIIGIVLSTALMVGIGLLVSTILSSERQNAINTFGSYHLALQNVDANAMSTINKNVNVKSINYYVPLGFARVDSSYDNKPYLYIVEGNQSLLKDLKLVEGTLPTNEHELLISNSFIPKHGSEINIGDTIDFEIGTRVYDGEEQDIAHNYSLPSSWEEDILHYMSEDLNIKSNRSYKVVGIVERPPYESYHDAGAFAFSLNQKSSNVYNAFVEYKNPKKTYENTKELLKAINDEASSEINQNLLYYYGVSKYSNINETILPLIIIALSVISVGCIIVIYNSFAISAMERKKSFGIYASIGATMKQIRSSVLFEAFIVGFIGIIIGIAGGFLGIYVVVQIINNLLADTFDYSFIFSVEPLYIIIPLIFMVIVILISAYLPAKRSSKIPPIVAIRGNDDIKISKKEVKSPKFIQKLFGVEGTIAYKNIKRNKKKYRITIISLFISIVMFNTFTSFLSYFVKASDAFDNYDYDLGVDFQGPIDVVREDIKYLKDNYKFDKYQISYDHNYVNVTNFKATDFTSDYQPLERYETLEDISIYLVVLNNEDYNQLTNKEALILNQKYTTIYTENERVTKDIKVFSKNNYQLNLTIGSIKTTLDAYTTEENIYGLKNYKYTVPPVIIISEDTYFNKIGYNDEISARVAISSKNYKELYNALDKKEITFKSHVTAFSPAEELANTKNILLVIKILVYGFITLVTLIGVTSVINTVNTNINLRRKEFAMLRSIGLTPNGFNKLLFFESLFFGLKSLIYGIPVSFAINVLISLSISNVIDTSIIINWGSFLITIIAVFLIVIMTMNYASKKIKRENILEALREENI